ncbi:hypothetical protein KQI36_04675 [Clostridium senegalense]|nr:hypothetical protein [Clostridium senegalense]MBU5225959.1 hypothetical protein [Clostridium senegalense]
MKNFLKCEKRGLKRMILVAMRAVNSSPPIEKLDIFLINKNVLEINNLIT